MDHIWSESCLRTRCNASDHISSYGQTSLLSAFRQAEDVSECRAMNRLEVCTLGVQDLNHRVLHSGGFEVGPHLVYGQSDTV